PVETGLSSPVIQERLPIRQLPSLFSHFMISSVCANTALPIVRRTFGGRYRKPVVFYGYLRFGQSVAEARGWAHSVLPGTAVGTDERNENIVPRRTSR